MSLVFLIFVAPSMELRTHEHIQAHQPYLFALIYTTTSTSLDRFQVHFPRIPFLHIQQTAVVSQTLLPICLTTIVDQAIL